MCSGGPWVCVGLLVGMGDTVTKVALEWALGCTDAVRACAEVTRFMNDLASFKVQVTLQDYHPYCLSFYLNDTPD
jgi:hypothetical protein